MTDKESNNQRSEQNSHTADKDSPNIDTDNKITTKLADYKKARQQMLKVVGFVGVFLVILWQGVSQKKAEPLVFDSTHLNAYELKALMALGQIIGDQQFFYADLSAIKQQVDKLSWVDSVSVRRDWHRGIVVSVKPKKAVANFGSALLIDASGQVFLPADKRELNNLALTYLKSDEKLAKTTMTQVYKINEWFNPLDLHLNDITLTDRGTWLLRFDNGFRITVDNERFDEKLFNLANLLKQDNALSAKKQSIASVDLRYKNGFSVAYKDELIQKSSL